jgi:hypothetical protein
MLLCKPQARHGEKPHRDSTWWGFLTLTCHLIPACLALQHAHVRSKIASHRSNAHAQHEAYPVAAPLSSLPWTASRIALATILSRLPATVHRRQYQSALVQFL